MLQNGWTIYNNTGECWLMSLILRKSLFIEHKWQRMLSFEYVACRYVLIIGMAWSNWAISYPGRLLRTTFTNSSNVLFLLQNTNLSSSKWYLWSSNLSKNKGCHLKELVTSIFQQQKVVRTICIRYHVHLSEPNNIYFKYFLSDTHENYFKWSR
jgi:hypothetical protein